MKNNCMDLPVFFVLIDHKPVPVHDIRKWGECFQKQESIVKQEDVGKYWVSTVFLGIDHGWNNKGDPVLFETMIRDKEKGEWLDYQSRYCTWDEAEAGHAYAVKLANRLMKYQGE